MQTATPAPVACGNRRHFIPALALPLCSGSGRAAVHRHPAVRLFHR
ncbi:hypothetical protein [Enterobacter hormaechei]|nr:hypothetical protein [Enterobacter hormaechei]EKK9105870.1 hypothetical protein [Salmonella enterica]